jgi:hypothetical protein
MEFKKKNTYCLGAILSLSLIVCLFLVENSNNNSIATEATSSYTSSSIVFGTSEDALSSYYSMTDSDISSLATLSGLTSSQISYTVKNVCGKKVNKYSTPYALQLGYPTNYYQNTTSSSLKVTLSGIKYQSVTVYADTYADSSNYYYNIPFTMNGTNYINDGSWGATSGASQGDCPTFVEYDCDNPKSELTITIPGTTDEGYDMIFIQKIKFHIPK